MIIIDENIVDAQRQLLHGWKIQVHQIGHEIGRQGIKDDSIIPLLHKEKNVTFFTRDFGFYDRSLCHAGYCLVWLDVSQNESASFIRRFLKHPSFNTHNRRMGLVARVSHMAIHSWKLNNEKEEKITWHQ